MKTNLTGILDACTPEELDDALRDMDAPLSADASLDRIQRRAMENAGIVRPVKRYRKALLIVAAIITVAAVLVGCYIADVAEYNRAVEFFELNSFSTEGLTRGEIKRVYRDITTESLSFDKSYEVIENNISADSVKGMDIRIMNNNAANNAFVDRWLDEGGEISVKGVDYMYDTEYDPGSGYTKYKSTRLTKYTDGKENWTATFEDFSISGYVVIDGAVLIYGETPYIKGVKPQINHIALIDDTDGSVRWHKELESEGKRYTVESAVYHDDKIALFSIADMVDHAEVGVRTVDLDGNVTLLNRYEIEDAVNIGELTALSDGYFVEVNCFDRSADPPYDYAYRTFLRIDADGNLLRTYRYDSDDAQYEIEDIFEHNGMVYISAQSRPTDSHLYENIGISDWEDQNGEELFSHYDDSVRDAVRDEFTSVLFVCDPDKGNPELFYSVGGTLPGKLSTNDDGSLRWAVQRIIKCGYSPFTSSFSFYGLTREYDYTFDYDNDLLWQEKTDLIGSFNIH